MKRIGITETYDPCFVPDWETKLLEANIVISKELNDEMIEKLLLVQDRVIFHHTVTGQGGTILEPNVKPSEYEFDQFKKLKARGFDLRHYVLRLDPIILWSAETQANIQKVLAMWSSVVDEMKQYIRCRVSVVDLYPHVKQRLDSVGFKVFYDTFTAPDAVFRRVDTILAPYYQKFTFEACADPKLLPYNILECGCASYKDIERLGLDPAEYGMQDKKQRPDCRCLAKKQILNVKPRRCPHGCLYCFWKD